MQWFGHLSVPAFDPETAASCVSRGALLVDVGFPRDWLSGHLPDAELVRVGLLEHDLSLLPKDRRLIVGARDDGRMNEVVALLRSQGRDAVALRGGIAAWHRHGLALEDRRARPT